MIPREQLNKTRKLLIRGLNWIGDAMMSVPTVWRLREHLPEAEITVLAPDWCADLYRICSAVDRALPPSSRRGGVAGINGEFRTAKALRPLNFDAAIILPNSFRSAVAPFVAGIPQRYGYRANGRSLMLTEGLPKRAVPRGHTVHCYRPLLHLLGVEWPEGSERFDIEINDAAHRETEEILSRNGVEPGAELIGFSPGAAWGPSKRWPAERFVEAARLLLEKEGRRALFFGAPGDNSLITEIIGNIDGPCVNLAGAFSLLRHLAAALDRCTVLVTNDSGPMHIATALRTPVVALFGPTDEKVSGPWTQPGGAARILRPPDCAPCYNSRCRRNGEYCLSRISGEEAARAAEELIAESKRKT